MADNKEDNIVEIEPSELKEVVKELVQKEITKTLLENAKADHLLIKNTDRDMTSLKYAEKRFEIAKEILNERIEPTEVQLFIEHIAKYHAQYGNFDYADANTLEDVAKKLSRDSAIIVERLSSKRMTWQDFVHSCVSYYKKEKNKKLKFEKNSNDTTKQERILEYISGKISKNEMDGFVKFAQKQLGESDEQIKTLNESTDILVRIADIFSQTKIPAGVSLNAIIMQYNNWHARSGAGIKGLGKSAIVENTESIESAEKEENQTADEAGGLTLGKIGKTIEAGTTYTATAVTDMLNKLTGNLKTKNGKEPEKGKLEILKVLLEGLGTESEIENDVIREFDKSLRRAVVTSAGKFVDFMEAARELDPEGNQVTLDGFLKVLEKQKQYNLFDSMDDKDTKNQNLLFERMIEIANNDEYATDDCWKDIVMNMFTADLLESPVFGTREQLNISKSFQNMVSNIMKPPAKRGRPSKKQII
jgi:hypothetical protein